jgi:hypothetical protein
LLLGAAAALGSFKFLMCSLHVVISLRALLISCPVLEPHSVLSRPVALRECSGARRHSPPPHRLLGFQWLPDLEGGVV